MALMHCNITIVALPPEYWFQSRLLDVLVFLLKNSGNSQYLRPYYEQIHLHTIAAYG